MHRINSKALFVKAKQKGVTLIEVVAGLGVLAMIITGLALLMNQSIEDVRAQQAAQHQAQIVRAVQEWILIPDNRDDVMTSASLTTPRVLDLSADLGRYLPPNFSDTNSYNQQACVRAFYDDPNKRIEFVVSTSGGAELNDALLGYAVGHAGPGAGGVYANPPADSDKGRGAYGGWVAPIANYPGGCAAPTPGHFMSLVPFDFSGTMYLGGAGEWLSRMEVTNRPELNRMSTAIDMNEYDINRILNAEVLESVFVGENVFASMNLHAGENVTAGDSVYATNNVLAGDSVIAQNHLTALDGDVYALNGHMISVDHVSSEYTSSYGAPIKASEAMNYGTLAQVRSSIPAPSCGSGTPQIFVSPAAFHGGTEAIAGGAYAYASGSGPWTVDMVVLAVKPEASVDDTTNELSIGFTGAWQPAPDGAMVLVSTKCSGT